MKESSKYFNPHHIFGGKTFEAYCANIPTFYFKKEIPEDVVKNFETIEKLLVHSYYEYKFIDEAFTKAILTLEMAMSIRYRDFNPSSKKKTFHPLITELYKLNLFDSNFETLHQIKNIRNQFAHPEKHTFGGIVYWNRIELISRLINEMYEDVNLRLERRSLTTDFLLKQNASNLNKSLVIDIQGEQNILFSLQLLFINNKYNKPTYLFACTPLFDLNIDENMSLTVPHVFKSKLISPIILDNVLEGISFSHNKVIKFSEVNKNKMLLNKFNEWNNEYNNVSYKHQFELSLNLPISQILIPELQEFQKM